MGNNKAVEKQGKMHESGARGCFYEEIRRAMKTAGVKKDSGTFRFPQLQGSSLLVAIEKLSENQAGFEELLCVRSLVEQIQVLFKSNKFTFHHCYTNTVEDVSLTEICYTSCAPFS